MRGALKNIGVTFVLVSSILILGGFRDIEKSQKEELVVNSIEVANDSVDLQFFQVNNADGIPQYYYREVDQFPCDDSVCERMQLRIYYDIFGNYLKLGFENGNELTKIGHKPFTGKDYEKIHKLLNNPQSGIQYYKLENLTNQQSEDYYYSPDAISGATVVNVNYDSVRGAVKTCFTLWKLAHDAIVDEIRALTFRSLADFSLQNPPAQYNELVTLLQSDIKTSKKELTGLYQQISLTNPVVCSCFLELVRQNGKVNIDVLDSLATLIGRGENVQEVEVYNLLQQLGYKSKGIRNYELSAAFF